MSQHEHTDCSLVVLRGVYDGALFWDCTDGEVRHRFPEGHYLWERAEQHMAHVRALKAGAL